MNMEVDEFLKAMEKGEIKSKEFIPKFAEELDKFADPGYRASINKTGFAWKQLTTSFTLFKEDIMKAGLGDMLIGVFTTLRHTIDAVTPAVKFLARTIAIAFTTATFPIRYMIAAIADFLDWAGLLDDKDDFLPNWAEQIAGITLGLIGMVAGLRLLKKVLSGISKLTGLSKLSGMLGGGSKSTGRLGGAVSAGAGAATGAVGKLGARAIPYVGGVLMGYDLVDSLMNAAIGDTAAGKWMKETTLSDLWSKMSSPETSIPEHLKRTGPESTLSGRGEATLNINITGDDSALSKSIQTEIHSENMNVLGNFSR